MNANANAASVNINHIASLSTDEACVMIDGVREVPIRSLAPGQKFECVLPSQKRLKGTLIRVGPGTVAVVLEGQETERTFRTQEGRDIVLKKSGGIVYWSPGTPVLATKEVRDITRWTTKGGTGVGDTRPFDEYRPKDVDNSQGGDSAMTEKKAGLPGLGSKAAPSKSKAKAKPAAKAKVAKTLNPCGCGCGDKVTGRFRQGHDARYYSILKKVGRGEMKISEMPKLMQETVKTVAAANKLVAEHYKK